MRLAIVAEGRTEEEFLKSMIRDQFRDIGIEVQPILLNGNVRSGRVASEMSRLFWSFDAVTSFVDYYGFKEKGDASPEALQAAIDLKSKAEIRRKYDETKVFSYVQQYEFEGLLFSEPEALDRLYGHDRQYGRTLARIKSQCRGPEDINDDPGTAPSKRLAQVMPRYSKVVDGPLIALEVGLDTIRSECPRFNAWISRLELLRCRD